MVRSSQIDAFTRFTQVSRETITSLKIYEKLLIEENKNLNLIGKSTINNIWIRHFLDSAQVIDLIDKNLKYIVDIGTGAGFPGLVMAIIAKDRKMPIKIKLFEKSSKKVIFLNKVISELDLKTEVVKKNIFDEEVKLLEDVFVSRAFRPLKIFLELMHKKANNLKKTFIFQGKTGESELLEASKTWDIEYKQSRSVTSNDSFILEIMKLKKKIE